MFVIAKQEIKEVVETRFVIDHKDHIFIIDQDEYKLSYGGRAYMFSDHEVINQHFVVYKNHYQANSPNNFELCKSTSKNAITVEKFDTMEEAFDYLIEMKNGHEKVNNFLKGKGL